MAILNEYRTDACVLQYWLTAALLFQFKESFFLSWLPVKQGVYDLTNSSNRWTSSLFFGVGMARTAVTFDGCGFNPSDVRKCPMYGTADCLISHF